MSEMILEAEDLCFTYDGSRTPALNKCSIQIRRGSRVAVLGSNGSGKSTILKIITGVLTPSTGQVQVNGKISALLELGAGFNMDYTENPRFFCAATGFINLVWEGCIMRENLWIIPEKDS